MRGKDTSPDPFAGYTPVRVSAVGCEQTDVPNPPKKYSFRKKEKRSFRRTLVGLVQAALFALVVLAVAVFSYGFIYRCTIDEPISALGSLTNHVQRLASAGRDFRASFDAPARTNATNVVNVTDEVNKISNRVDVVECQVRTNAPVKPAKRQIDPALKRFYNGGRKGRKLGPKEDE